MKVILLRDQKILHKAGETVEVSPLVFNNLVALGTAKPVEAAQATKKRTKKGEK